MGFPNCSSDVQVLLVGPHSNDTIASIAKTNLPVVRIGWPGPLEQADVVMGTDHEGGQAVLEYLISLGHRSIVYVYGAPIYRGRHERYYGAEKSLSDIATLRCIRCSLKKRMALQRHFVIYKRQFPAHGLFLFSRWFGFDGHL